MRMPHEVKSDRLLVHFDIGVVNDRRRQIHRQCGHSVVLFTRKRTFRPAHSALIPTFLITSFHFAISFFRYALNASGVLVCTIMPTPK
jgi:hypothetical protein